MQKLSIINEIFYFENDKDDNWWFTCESQCLACLVEDGEVIEALDCILECCDSWDLSQECKESEIINKWLKR